MVRAMSRFFSIAFLALLVFFAGILGRVFNIEAGGRESTTKLGGLFTTGIALADAPAGVGTEAGQEGGDDSCGTDSGGGDGSDC